MGLRFPPALVDGVRDGRISMQFGLWKRPRVVAGRVYVVKGVGIVRVTAVEKLDLGRLTPWEANAAGAADVSELRQWLKEEYPSADPAKDTGYRIRFRYLGPETGTDEGGEAPSDEEGDREEEGEEAPSAVPPKAIPRDLMDWIGQRDWRPQHLRLLSSGVWRNADDLSAEVEVDAATTRRRMGDLRKRGLVTSHRHHGYRITPEGQGALAGMVDASEGAAGASAADWLGAKRGRSEIIELLRDGRWHNAAEIGEAMQLSVVSVQRRVAALRDRGLVESHRRRGYRLTDVGFEALGMVPGDSVQVMPTPEVVEVPTEVPEPGRSVEPLPSSLLEWLERQPYRKDLVVAIPFEDYISASELAELLGETNTTLHGRLATLRDKGLVDSLPRKGYRLTPKGVQATEVIRAMEARSRAEPVEASAFLSAESDGWSSAEYRAVPATPPAGRVDVRTRRRMTTGDACGFCQATSLRPASSGWITEMQYSLESPGPDGKGETIPCDRGVFEDGAWFLVVDRNPLAEGHCKMVCKEHVHDLIELAEWSNRDQKLAHVRDSMSRDILLAVEVVSSLDPRIVDVMVLTGLEHGGHLHFDLVPRYRMDLPGLRPVSSTRSYYDDLSLSKKRRLWKARREHLQEVAQKLRGVARVNPTLRGTPGVRITER